jgi:hypothetical protein
VKSGIEWKKGENSSLKRVKEGEKRGKIIQIIRN